MRAESFSCSLGDGVLYGGIGISKLQFLIKKIKNKISICKFFSILDHQTLDPDPGSGSGIRNLDPGSGSGIPNPDPESGSGIRIQNPDPQLEKMLDPDPYPDLH